MYTLTLAVIQPKKNSGIRHSLQLIAERTYHRVEGVEKLVTQERVIDEVVLTASIVIAFTT